MPVGGYGEQGLGLARVEPHTRTKPALWGLYHLGSGHSVCYIRGDVRTAFAVAADILDCGDWTFIALDGFRNVAPDLPERVAAILCNHPDLIESSPSGPHLKEVAQKIARTF